jgi:hypothetical protein
MKTILLAFFLLSATLAGFGQSKVKATIHLKDGKTIEAYHFGKLKCEPAVFGDTYITLRGLFSGTHTEIKDYSDVSKLVLSGFTAAPAASVGNQKGKITVIKKNGVSVPLDEAELVMSCFGHEDRYNEIHVQVMNPLTNELIDQVVEMNKIESITF